MYGGRTWRWGYDNGGKWLMSVNPHPTDGNPRHLVGFYHAEDGFWPYQGAGGPAWKAIGVTHSWDAGITVGEASRVGRFALTLAYPPESRILVA
jgi:hypothetical protein